MEYCFITFHKQKRLEEERRLKKKMKKKEREERAKQEGRFLTEKQKQDRLRLNQMLQLGMCFCRIYVPSETTIW